MRAISNLQFVHKLLETELKPIQKDLDKSFNTDMDFLTSPTEKLSLM